MRTIYDTWAMLDANSSIMISELQPIENENIPNSSIMIDELKDTNLRIIIYELRNGIISTYNTSRTLPDIEELKKLLLIAYD